MYEKIKNKKLKEQIEWMTRELIQKESYNGTEGEKEKALFLYETIRSFPYFRKNSDAVWLQELENGNRFNVWALIKRENKNNTILYHAHIDTVGTEDFGGIQPIAHQPEKLQAYFSTFDGEEEVRVDAQSGEWLFGRGALDMQSGISIHLANLLYYSSHLEQLDGNVLVLFNVDEENQHVGIRAALNELIRLQEEMGLNYIAAINNDFISPLYNGDRTKYIYCGGAGKLLPCFSIVGREAHVGESLLGIDPTLVGSEINRRVNQNFFLAEKLENELVLPPSCLYMKENKNSYDVQTPVSLRMYFNYFIYEATATEILSKLKQIANDACQTIRANLSANFQQYRAANQLPERTIDWKLQVMTLQEYVLYLEKLNLEPESAMKKVLLKANDSLDDRMKAFEMVEALQMLDPDKEPKVILFFAAPFLPSNTIQENTSSYKVKEVLEEVLKSATLKYQEPFMLRRYFPYLCDGSFLAFHGDEKEVEAVEANFPGMNTFFPLSLEKMRLVNIPALNLGVYGKGGHKWTERVYKPYTFQILPLLIREVTEKLINKIDNKESSL